MLGQILLARRMGKPRVIAETGAGMHGVATATLCARSACECVVYMGAVDVERQKPNVFRMQHARRRGACRSSRASKTLKDAMNEALRDWVTNVADTFYCIGTVAGPHPYPMMVRDFQSSSAARRASRCRRPRGGCRTRSIACIGGGSNAMGLFHPFLDDGRSRSTASRRRARPRSGMHAASIAGGRPGVLHGNRTYLLMDEDGQIEEAHSISAGLDYPGIGPEHAWLDDIGRVKYLSATDKEALGGVPALLASSRASFPRWSPRTRWQRCWTSRRRSRRII